MSAARRRHYPAGSDVPLFWIDGFLSPSQCARALEDLDFAHWRPSGVTDHHPLRGAVTKRSPQRVSESTTDRWFSPALRRMMRGVDQRLDALVPHFIGRREAWQATRYARGGKFDYHYDGGQWDLDPAGDRVYTTLLYLEGPRRGGSTHFRELDVDVSATPGRLVVWRNLTAGFRRDSRMLHAGMPVLAGSKTVLVTWVRQRHIHQGG